MKGKKTRERIIAAADQLFYTQGFEQTSFADIAEAVQISSGNFYYHYKTKDDILAAVIALRLKNTQTMLDTWTLEGETPAGRIQCFIQILIRNQTKILASGCPVGTLTSELAKLNHTAQDDAAGLFSLFRAWLGQQFRLMGRESDADQLAMHLLGRSQGVAILANAFKDETYVEQEVAQMGTWLKEQSAGAH